LKLQNKILHVGYPKTGTSALQKLLFDSAPEVDNIGKPWGKIEKKCPKSGAEFVVYSDEDLSFPFEYDDKGNIIYRDRLEKLMAIKAHFIPDRILITLREKNDIAYSWYKYHKTRGRIESESFIEYKKKYKSTYERVEEALDLDLLKDDLASTFGTDVQIDIVNYSQSIVLDVAHYIGLSDERYYMLDKSKVNASPATYKEIYGFSVLKKIFGLEVANRIRNRFGKEHVLK
jgi:hypothetical protein